MLTACATVSRQTTPPSVPVIVTEPNKCEVLDASLLVRPQSIPTREPQGNVTAEEKITFLEGWLNDSLIMNRELSNQVNAIVDQLDCE
jgi:hypothetical protein